jgi:hypothetical protein
MWTEFLARIMGVPGFRHQNSRRCTALAIHRAVASPYPVADRPADWASPSVSAALYNEGVSDAAMSLDLFSYEAPDPVITIMLDEMQLREGITIIATTLEPEDMPSLRAAESRSCAAENVQSPYGR